MKRGKVYYVMPLGEVWLVRGAGSRAEAYPTIEAALAAAERLSARGAHVRVLTQPGRAAPLPSLAKAAPHAPAPASRRAGDV